MLSIIKNKKAALASDQKEEPLRKKLRAAEEAIGHPEKKLEKKTRGYYRTCSSEPRAATGSDCPIWESQECRYQIFLYFIG